MSIEITPTILRLFQEGCSLKAPRNERKVIACISRFLAHNHLKHRYVVRIIHSARELDHLRYGRSQLTTGSSSLQPPNDAIDLIWDHSPCRPAKRGLTELFIPFDRPHTMDIGWTALQLNTISFVEGYSNHSIIVNDMALFDAFLAGAWQLLMDNHTVYILMRPDIVKADENNRLHCVDGPAFQWEGEHLYYWHGAIAPTWLIEQPEKITIESIQNEANLTMRSILLERYGLDRFMNDSGASQIDRVTIRGRNCDLYHLRPDKWSIDQSITMIKVTNATPEPDGTFKDYWLRVPPNFTSAIAAVAWTFNMSAPDYSQLIFES